MNFHIVNVHCIFFLEIDRICSLFREFWNFTIWYALMWVCFHFSGWLFLLCAIFSLWELTTFSSEKYWFSFSSLFVAWHTVLVAKAAITKYQTGWPDNRNLFSQSRGQKSKIKVLAKLVLSDASVLGLWVAIFTWSSLCVSVPLIASFSRISIILD